jgi:hypothetical protein
MKKTAIQPPRSRGTKTKPITTGKHRRPKAKLVSAPAPKQWPDFKSRITKLRVKAGPVRDIIDDLRQERV